MPIWFILSVCAAICWGAQYAIYGAKLTHIRATEFSLIYFFFATIVYGVIAGFRGGPYFTNVTVGDLKWLAAVIILGTAGSLLIALSIQGKNAALASMIEISYPLFVTIFGILLFKEDIPDVRTWIGGGLIMSGVIIMSKA